MDPKAHLILPSAMGRDIFPYPGCSKAHPTWTWINNYRHAAAPAYLGNLCQVLNTFTVKNLILISNLSLFSFSPLLSYHYNNFFPFSFWAPFRYWTVGNFHNKYMGHIVISIHVEEWLEIEKYFIPVCVVCLLTLLLRLATLNSDVSPRVLM